MDITNFETVTLDEASGTLLICDQTKLPGEVTFLSLSNAKDIWNAIYLLQVRGAPAIGVAAAIGLWVVTKGLFRGTILKVFTVCSSKKRNI
ncbi:MAG: hypothetical protein LKE28_07710 [Sphaerochaeta sp.]|nr:hypothetical protein [Sphaerochaeta sp.]